MVAGRAEDWPDRATLNYRRVVSAGGATLARIAWLSSAGLVNCGQWPGMTASQDEASS